MKKTIAILGSSRSDGNTMLALRTVLGEHPTEIIDISACNITPYDYKHQNQQDDFMPIAEEMSKADLIIFATPIYWYSMSSQLKTFFDRFSDLLTINKTVGRQLKGKECCLVVSGGDDELTAGFDLPIRKTCEYMEMPFHGTMYCAFDNEDNIRLSDEEQAKEFGNQFFALGNTTTEQSVEG